MTSAVEPSPILYFDASALNYYRGKHEIHSPKLEQIFEHAENEDIACTTSTFTRAEMFNVAKRAAYVQREITLGRIDVNKIANEALHGLRLQHAELSAIRAGIDGWFRSLVERGRLRVHEPPDPSSMWRVSEVFMEQTSISGTGDCIQLAIAVLSGTSIFVTEDQQLLHCVQKEVLAEGEPRTNIEAALLALTGASELSLKAMDIHSAHVHVERQVAGAHAPSHD